MLIIHQMQIRAQLSLISFLLVFFGFAVSSDLLLEQWREDWIIQRIDKGVASDEQFCTDLKDIFFCCHFFAPIHFAGEVSLAVVEPRHNQTRPSLRLVGC